MFIFSNTAISLDGKISTIKNDHLRLGSQLDIQKMDELRERADAVVVGGNTFRNNPQPLVAENINNKKPIYNVIMTRTFEFENLENLAGAPSVIPLFFGPIQKAPKDLSFRVVDFQPGDSLIKLVSFLKDKGVQNILVEAGGELIFRFVQEGLLNEMYVTLCPWLIGGQGSPSLLSGEGFLKEHIKRLDLLSCQTVGNEIYLNYRVNY